MDSDCQWTVLAEDLLQEAVFAACLRPILVGTAGVLEEFPAREEPDEDYEPDQLPAPKKSSRTMWD